MGGDLLVQPGRPGAGGQVALTGVGGDGETGRHGQAEIRHFREVGALAAQQVLQVPVTFGEVVDVFRAGAGALHTDRLPGFEYPAETISHPGSEG
jgi:hypothetical protein